MVRLYLFRALRHRNFRLFFTSQAVSILGSWMQQIALAWLVYRTTGSAFLLGVVTFANQAPILFIAPFSGLLADRFDRRKMLMITQSLAAGQALLLAALTLSGTIETWHIIVLALFYGIAMGLDTPVRQSLLIDMIGDRSDLPNAIALNSFLMNSGRLIGPSIAGVLLLYVSEGVCFLINAASFLGVVWVATQLPRKARSTEIPPGYLRSLADALEYAWRTETIRVLLAMVASIAFFASSYLVLMPVFARDVFGGGAATLGFLVGAAGFGAVIGTAVLAGRGRVETLPRRLMFTSALAGVALSLVGLSGTLWLALPLMVCLGFGIIVTAASANMVIQSIVPDEKRGRIVSFYAASFLGVMPVGALSAGSLASRIGAPATAMLFGACCVLLGLVLGAKLRKSRG